MVRASSLLLVAGVCVALGSPVACGEPPAATGGSAAAPMGKKPVKSQDDLPRHTYQIEGKASEFVVAGEPFRVFLARFKADTEADLAGYDITDPTTLQGYYNALASVAMIEGRFDDAVKYADMSREIETKEAQKIYAGTQARAIAKAKKGAGDDAAYRAAFARELDAAVRAMPWEKVREIVKQNKGRAEILTRDLLMGQLQTALDPVVEKSGGEISGDIARALVGLRAQLDVMMPLREEVVATFTKIIDDNATAARDIWAERAVELTEKNGLAPVVMAVWDSGVDMAIFAQRGVAWSNERETVNGKDDDGNGFVDDVHGIAFDLDSKAVPELLHPLEALKGDKAEVVRHTKGLTDLQANIDSADAAALRQHLATLKGEAVGAFIEDLSLYGNHMHGTHVAGIASAGNPAARILCARITFDYRQIPTKAPSVERARAEAAAAKQTVNYFKAAGVRVVNMSWGGSRQDIEGELERKNVGKDAQERAALSRVIFATMKEGLDEAMRSAPDILFIAAAGNSNNNSQFSEMIPSGLEVGNMITVGAVDQSGKPTGFTTFGKNVKLYSNGFEVESDLPGGGRMKASGTSMAAPNVANLAGKLFALDPKLTSKEVVELMVKGADPMPGSSEAEGRLLINPKKTVELLRKRGG